MTGRLQGKTAIVTAAAQGMAAMQARATRECVREGFIAGLPFA